MTLGELILALDKIDPQTRVPRGFHKPHSYRGYYEQLAFEPAENISIGEMLAAARSALGKTFTGYKGGDYLMHEYVDCWISKYGHADGNGIGETLIWYMANWERRA
jgi:hypothetical protein